MLGPVKQALDAVYEKEFDDPLYIVGIDPGVTTGISVLKCDVSEGIPRPGDQDKIFNYAFQLSYGGSGNTSDRIDEALWAEQEVAFQIWSLIYDLEKSAPHGRVILVIEDFIIRIQNSSRDFLSPVRVTAGIMQMLYADSHTDVPIFLQPPSDAKTICTDERLDKWGYTIQTQRDRHGRDATRHSVLFLRKLLQDRKMASSLLK